jgi:hypothetical protein
LRVSTRISELSTKRLLASHKGRSRLSFDRSYLRHSASRFAIGKSIAYFAVPWLRFALGPRKWCTGFLPTICWWRWLSKWRGSCHSLSIPGKVGICHCFYRGPHCTAARSTRLPAHRRTLPYSWTLKNSAASNGHQSIIRPPYQEKTSDIGNRNSLLKMDGRPASAGREPEAAAAPPLEISHCVFQLDRRFINDKMRTKVK